MTVNAHTHLDSALVPYGMPAPQRAPRDFREILARVWWRLDRALDEASLRAAARLYAAEAREYGTTIVIDHHESPSMIEGSLDIVADACEEFELFALVCYGATERNGGVVEARRGLAECRRFIRANRRRYVRGAIGLHAAFAFRTRRSALRDGCAGTLMFRFTFMSLRTRAMPADSSGSLRAKRWSPDRSSRNRSASHGEGSAACRRDAALARAEPRARTAQTASATPPYCEPLHGSRSEADGFPSDMSAETALLCEPPAEVRRRVENGCTLAREIFPIEGASLRA